MKRRRAAPRVSLRRIVAVAAGVSALWILANAAKPFHIDDPFHLIWARTIRPLAGEVPERLVSWQKYDEPMPAQTAHHPPAWSLLLACVRGGTGDREWILHWLEWPFAAAFLAGAALLAGTLGESPWAALALCATSPLFLLPAASLMPDLPSAGPAVLGIAIWMRARKWRPRAAAALLLVLAAQMKQSVLPLLPLLVIDPPARLTRSRLRWGLAACVLVLGGWFPNVAPHEAGGNSIVAHLAGVWGRAGGAPLLLPKLGYALAVLAAAALAPAGYAAAVAAAGSGRLITGVGGPILAVWALVRLGFWNGFVWGGWKVLPAPDSPNTLWFLASIACLLAWGWILLRRRPLRGLAWPGIWIALGLAGYVVGSPFPAARHLLPLLPPVVFVFLASLRSVRKPRRRRVVLAAALAGNAWLSLSLARTDYAFAVAERDAAERGRRLAAELRLPLVTTGGWGLRHYVERAGGSPLRRAADILPDGAVLLVPAYADHRVPSARIVRRAIRRETWTFPPPSLWLFPARTIPSPAFAASFHGGPYWFPYAFARHPLEMVRVYVIPPLHRGARP